MCARALPVGDNAHYACVQGSTNGTNGIPISFTVLRMVPLVLPLVPMVMPMPILLIFGNKITNGTIGRTPNRAFIIKVQRNTDGDTLSSAIHDRYVDHIMFHGFDSRALVVNGVIGVNCTISAIYRFIGCSFFLLLFCPFLFFSFIIIFYHHFIYLFIFHLFIFFFFFFFLFIFFFFIYLLFLFYFFWGEG